MYLDENSELKMKKINLCRFGEYWVGRRHEERDGGQSSTISMCGACELQVK